MAQMLIEQKTTEIMAIPIQSSTQDMPEEFNIATGFVVL